MSRHPPHLVIHLAGLSAASLDELVVSTSASASGGRAIGFYALASLQGSGTIDVAPVRRISGAATRFAGPRRERSREELTIQPFSRAFRRSKLRRASSLSSRASS